MAVSSGKVVPLSAITNPPAHPSPAPASAAARAPWVPASAVAPPQPRAGLPSEPRRPQPSTDCGDDRVDDFPRFLRRRRLGGDPDVDPPRMRQDTYGRVGLGLQVLDELIDPRLPDPGAVPTGV